MIKPKLEIQEFLRNGGTKEQLLAMHSIKAKEHPKYNNLVLFKYDQIASDFSKNIVQECRGIILDADNDWSVVSFPFKKFFNHEEPLAPKLEWNRARVYEKLDGSLITCFPYDGKWQVASSGTPDAGGQVNGFDITFKQLFLQCLNGSDFPDASTCRMCFMFELTSKYNRVVVQYDEPKITLIGARCLDTYEESEAWVAHETYFSNSNFTHVKSFDVKDLDSLISARDNLNPKEQEGYIVWDLENRVKVKNLEYVKLHHLKDGLQSPRSLMRVVMEGEVSEVISALPEFSEELLKLQSKYDTLVSLVEKDYEELKDIEVQKDFALAAKGKLVSSPLFALRNKKATSVKEFLSQIQVDTVLELCGKMP